MHKIIGREHSHRIPASQSKFNKHCHTQRANPINITRFTYYKSEGGNWTEVNLTYITFNTYSNLYLSCKEVWFNNFDFRSFEFITYFWERLIAVNLTIISNLIIWLSWMWFLDLIMTKKIFLYGTKYQSSFLVFSLCNFFS